MIIVVEMVGGARDGEKFNLNVTPETITIPPSWALEPRYVYGITERTTSDGKRRIYEYVGTKGWKE